MDGLRSPLYLLVAIFSLAVAGVPVFGADACVLTWVQYLFTAWVTVAYGSVGLVALYHLATDQSPVDTVYFKSFAIWMPYMTLILLSICRREMMRELFRKMFDLQESVQDTFQKERKCTLALVTAKPLIHAFSVCISLYLHLERQAGRLGLDFHENEILVAITFIQASFLWCALYYNLNLVNAFEINMLEVADHQLLSQCHCPSVISVHSHTSAEDSSCNEISQVNDSSSARCRRPMCRSHESQKSALQKLSKLKEIRNKNNQTYYIPYVVAQTCSTYSFLTNLSLQEWRFSMTIWISFGIAIVLTTAFALSLCGFRGHRISATRMLQSKIKREIYTSRDFRERKLLRRFTSSIEDPYPDHACIFFDFDFAILGLVVETSCLVITTLYTGNATV